MKYLLIISLTLLISSTTSAALHIRDLDGNWSNGHEGVYDDVLDITWLADATLAATQTFGVSNIISGSLNTGEVNVPYDGAMGWNTAIDWIAEMNTSNYFGYSNWRLPLMTDIGNDGCDLSSLSNSECGYNALTYDAETQTVFNELAFMFFENFGANSYRNPDNTIAESWGLENAADPNGYLDLFENIHSTLFGVYYTGLHFSPEITAQMPGGEAEAVYMAFYNGEVGADLDILPYNVWAVHEGDIGSATVPAPTTAWLFLSSITGLLLTKRKLS